MAIDLLAVRRDPGQTVFVQLARIERVARIREVGVTIVPEGDDPRRVHRGGRHQRLTLRVVHHTEGALAERNVRRIEDRHAARRTDQSNLRHPGQQGVARDILPGAPQPIAPHRVVGGVHHAIAVAIGGRSGWPVVAPKLVAHLV